MSVKEIMPYVLGEIRRSLRSHRGTSRAFHAVNKREYGLSTAGAGIVLDRPSLYAA